MMHSGTPKYYHGSGLRRRSHSSSTPATWMILVISILLSCSVVKATETNTSSRKPSFPSLEPLEQLPWKSTHRINIQAKTPHKVLRLYHEELAKVVRLRSFKNPPFFVQQTTALITSELSVLLYPHSERTREVKFPPIHPKCDQKGDGATEKADSSGGSEMAEEQPEEKDSEEKVMPLTRCYMDYLLPSRPQVPPSTETLSANPLQFRLQIMLEPYDIATILKNKDQDDDGEREGVSMSIQVDLSLIEDVKVDVTALEAFVNNKMIPLMKLIDVTEQSVVERQKDEEEDEKKAEEL